MSELSIEERLAALERRNATLDAAYACDPFALRNRRKVSVENPIFVQQLRDIEKDENSILVAADEFLRSGDSRRNWYRSGYVTESDVLKYEDRLIAYHDSHFNRPIVSGESDVARGQETLRRCEHDALSARVADRDPYVGFEKGTLHTLADERLIGWHPKWEEKYGKKERDDRT